MTTRSKIGMATLVAGASLAAGLVASPGAQATPSAEIGPAQVDWCLSASVDDQGWSDIITITNWCGYDVRAKIVLDYAVDHCVTAPPGDSRYRINFPARFNRLAECD
jgi:hypothetical protein